MKYSVIKNKNQYENYMVELEKLLDLNPLDGTEESEEKELLLFLVEAYEKENFKIEETSAIETIKFIIEQNDLKQKDLIPIFGAQSRVSEILSGKRSLSNTMIENLNELFKIPYELLHRAKKEVSEKLKKSNDIINIDDVEIHKSGSKLVLTRRKKYGKNSNQLTGRDLMNLINERQKHK